MTNQQILTKIKRLTDSFQTEENNLKKFIILHEYMNLLKTDLKLKAIFELEENSCKQTVTSMVNSSYSMADMKANTPGGFNPDNNTNMFYSLLDYMYHTMEEYKAFGDKDEDKIKEVENKIDTIFQTPMQATLFGVSFSSLNKKIINKLSKEDFKASSKDKNKLSFDKTKSELNIFGQTVKIQLKNDKPNDHYVLEYLFEQDNIFDEADFQDIAREKLEMSKYDNTKDWNVLRHACDRLNKKVEKSTKGQEKKFLIYTTGKTGWCKINPKYQ